MKIYIVLISVIVCQLNAQIPEWVKNQGRSVKYPSAQFLTGYGVSFRSDRMDLNDTRGRAVDNARKNLIEKIRVKIQSVSTSKSEETGESYSSLFSSAVHSTSDLEISGLMTETYDDDASISYAFVYVKREHVVSLYSQTVRSLKEKIGSALASAEGHEQQSQKTRALKEYLSCMPLMRELEETQSILVSVSSGNGMDELEANGASNEYSLQKIREAIQKLVGRPIKDVDDAAWFIVNQLSDQIEAKGKIEETVLITPPVFQDTRMGSSFSRYFQTLLEQKMSETGQWKIAPQTKAHYILIGSYWEQQNGIKFIVSIKDVSDGSIRASAEAFLPKEAAAAVNRSLLPENFHQAMTDRKIFAEGEMARGGLNVEAWTNKEQLGNLFVSQEKMKVTVRVNLPCYIRFIYHMADGKRVMLINEYYMDASKVNIPYEIPQTFISMPPFGSEVLQIVAQTERFGSVQTRMMNGFEYIESDLQTIVQEMRGMQAVKPELLQSEKRIIITTMKE